MYIKIQNSIGYDIWFDMFDYVSSVYNILVIIKCEFGVRNKQTCFPGGLNWHDHAAFQSVGIQAADWQRC